MRSADLSRADPPPEDEASRAMARFLDAFDRDPTARPESFRPEGANAARLFDEAHEGWRALVGHAASLGGDEVAGDAGSRPEPEVEGFRILRELGRGGMGVVYEAVQESPPRRVALKVIRGDATSPLQHQLFQREITILARLNHPGIATIFGAGRAEDGQPYFAMELVEGTPFDRAQREAGTDRDAALARYDRICEAIAFAHRRGVIHRDLKPSNILVDREGRPRILDFGLARFMTRSDDASGTTRDLVLRGTLGYMSPEQARGNSDDVDTRSDVYALGVILYETLVGRPPYRLPQTSPIEAARMICETAPSPPRQAARDLPADLETIVLRALEKDPARRYQSVDALRDDLLRFRRGESILARPPTALERVRRTVRRHRGWFAAGVVLFAASLLFVVVLLEKNRQLVRAVDDVTAARGAERVARESAEAAARRASSVADFLRGVLSAADPRRVGPDATVRQVLDLAAGDLDEGMLEDPALELELRTALGRTYAILGANDAAESLLRRALALDVETVSGQRAKLEATRWLAYALQGSGQSDEAVAHYERLLAAAEGDPDADDIVVTEAMFVAASGLMSERRFSDAERILERLVPAARRAFAAGDPRLDNFILTLARARIAQGRIDEATAICEDVCDRFMIAPPAQPLEASEVGISLTQVLYFLERYADADRVGERALAATARDCGEDHERTANVLHSLAAIRLRLGRPHEAVELARRALEIRRARVGDRHYLTYSTQLTLADSLQDSGRLIEARDVLLEVRRNLMAMNAPPEAQQQALVRLSEVELALDEAGKAVEDPQ